MFTHSFRRRWGIAVAALAAVIAAGAPACAFAYVEPNPLLGSNGCSDCHPAVWVDPPGSWQMLKRPPEGGDCDACHAPFSLTSGSGTGPHGGYTASSRKCSACHDVHAAAGSILLPAPSVAGACFTCHDGTGGFGVYGTIAKRGKTVGATHRVEGTSTIPGGDAVSGGSATRVFAGAGGTLTCNDCHNPHAAQVVAAFKGDRKRVRQAVPNPTTSKLLRQLPSGATTPVVTYGSDWCLACHAGRASGGAVHNHPVESTQLRADPFTYGNVAILASEAPTGTTILGPLGGIPFATAGGHWAEEPDNSGNRGFLMPFPRTPQQGTHRPICQQCHEDSRNVGTLSADGLTADAATAVIAPGGDGVEWDSGNSTWTVSTVDNPMFQNFPHETQNTRMLVEGNDDLCMNCHPPAMLP